MIPVRYQQKNAWPHRFTKVSGEVHGDNGEKWQYMQCVHCDAAYIQGYEPKPIGVCPGRNDKETLRRLGVD